jgi:hypothetical protein
MRILDSPADQPPIVVLQGEPGIGKTTLWLAGIEQARQRGFRVLSCRPSAAEAQLSYASLADLLADIDDDLLKFLPDPQRRAIDFVLLRGPAEQTVTDYRATGAALLSVLDRLADDMPVMLAIDDLQWMDSSTAQVVDFALRRLSSPVAVLGAMRSPGASDPELPLLPSDPDRIHRIRVGPLTLGALHQMLRTRTGWSFPGPRSRGSSRSRAATRSTPSNSPGVHGGKARRIRRPRCRRRWPSWSGPASTESARRCSPRCSRRPR